MASSSISIPKRHEITFQSKCIDAKRFAYDLIKYSALKFNVPETCISVWKGPENAYGCSNFLSVLFKVIVGCQIKERYHWRTFLNREYESNKPELTGKLLPRVMNKYKGHPLMNIINEIVISLSFSSELVIFLYSKKLNLDLKQLAEDWFDCYFRFKKMSFETKGGLDILYRQGIRTELKLDEAFDDKFISVYCLPYEESAKNHSNLQELYKESYADYLDKILEHLTPKGWKETDDIFVREYSREGSIKGYEIIMLPVTSERNKPSAINILQNMFALIPNFDEWLRTDGALVIDAALSQIFPESSSQDRAPYPSVLSSKKKTKKESSLSASVEQGLGQLSLDSASTSLKCPNTVPESSSHKSRKGQKAIIQSRKDRESQE